MSNNRGGESGQRGDDAPIIILIIACTVYFGLWALWHFHHAAIAMGYTYVRYFELSLFSFLGGLTNLPGLAEINAWTQKTCAPSQSNFLVCTRDFEEMSWGEITKSSIWINLFFFSVLTYKCIRWFMYVNKHHPLIRFQTTHNIKSFVKMNEPLYPHLHLFSSIDMISKPLDHPVFGMSLTSRQFAFRHGLISGWRTEPDGSLTPTLDREKAISVFRVQLGKHWTKSTELSPAETLLAAIAIPRVAATDTKLNDDQFKSAMDDSNEIIRYCWDQFRAPQDKGQEEYGWLVPEIDLARPREIILKYIGTEVVAEILERHAFNRTILCAFFLEARRLGVLQPAEMRWLRFYDREMWYVLQNIGRQAVLAEGGAVIAHYLYEAKSRSAIPEPQLDKAVNGLELAMMSFKYLPSDKASYEAMQTNI